MTATDLLQAMAELSGQMVGAAQANQWPHLIALQEQLSELQAQLMALEPQGRQSQPLSPSEQGRKAAYARQILDDQATILSHVEPVQEDVRKLLSTNALGQTLRKAYSLPGA